MTSKRWQNIKSPLNMKNFAFPLAYTKQWQSGKDGRLTTSKRNSSSHNAKSWGTWHMNGRQIDRFSAFLIRKVRSATFEDIGRTKFTLKLMFGIYCNLWYKNETISLKLPSSSFKKLQKLEVSPLKVLRCFLIISKVIKQCL